MNLDLLNEFLKAVFADAVSAETNFTALQKAIAKF